MTTPITVYQNYITTGQQGAGSDAEGTLRLTFNKAAKEITISGDFIAKTDNVYHLGSETRKFKEVYTHELSTSENSLTLGDGYKISTTGNQLGILKVRDKNKLPPMITNFRDALFDYGVLFLQKYKKTTKNNKSSVKVHNYLKLLKTPDQYKAQSSTNLLIDILNSVVVNDTTGIYTKTNNSSYSSFEEMWVDYSGNENVNWKYNSLISSNYHTYNGKTFSYKNNVDEIEFGKITLQRLRDFIENDVQNAINAKRLSEGVSTVFEIGAAFNSGLRFDQEGKIIGQFNQDVGAYETGTATNIYEMAFTNEELAFGSYNASSSSGIITDSSKQAVSAISKDYMSITVPSSQFIDTTLDYSLHPHRLELRTTVGGTEYYEEQSVLSVSGSGTNLIIRVQYPFYLEGQPYTYPATNLTKVKFDIFSDNIMGYGADNTTSDTIYGVIEDTFDKDNWTTSYLESDFNDVSGTSRQICLLPYSLTYTMGIYIGYYVKIESNTGASLVDSAGNELHEVEAHTLGYDNNGNSYNMIKLKNALTTDIVSNYTFELTTSTSYAATYDSDNVDLMNTYTYEDYYDPAKNTADKFNNFLMSQLTSTASVASATTGLGVWNNTTYVNVDSFSGVSGTQMTDTLTNIGSTNIGNFLTNQIEPSVFDAGELLAYNEEDYFIMYSMIPKNNFAAYTNDNYMIGFKTEPNKDPYCKLTINGSAKTTKQIVVEDSFYKEAKYMTYLKNNLAQGTIFAQRLILGKLSNAFYDVRKTPAEGGLSIIALDVGTTEQCRIDGAGNITTEGNLNIEGIVSISGATIIHNTLTAHTIYQPSDKRLKHSIKNIDVSTSVSIHKLRPVSFRWNDESQNVSNKSTYGFIAQEVQEQLPSLVHEKNNILKMNYIELIPLMIKELQELKQMNISLQSRITELESSK